MLPFDFKKFNWIKKGSKKPGLMQIGLICLAVFILITSLNYALPMSGSDKEEGEGTDSGFLDNLFLFRNLRKKEISFQITDPYGSSTDPEVALSNQFAYANDNKFYGLLPGDKLDFSYEITNTGTEALDIRETYYILSFIPQPKTNLDFGIFKSTTLDAITGGHIGLSGLTSEKLDSAGRLYSFTSEPYTISGSYEQISGCPSTQRSERYMVFNRFAGNQTQGKPIYIVTTLEYKEHSSDDWIPSITETIIVKGFTKTMEYRTDTDVYLSCDIVALDFVNPDNPGSVTFTVTDPTGAQTTLTYSGFNSPLIGIQRAYVPFHIPDVTGEMTVSISSSENVFPDTKEIVATVVSSDAVTPPDPTLDMIIPPAGALPLFKENKSHEWVTYSASKNAEGEWEYEEHNHSASLNSNFLLTPDSSVKTATGSTLGSGYGVDAEINTVITTDDEIFDIQNVYCYFPEFGYEDYSRKLEAVSQNLYNTSWAFTVNKYSHRSSRVHYIPPAYPNGLYTVFGVVRDAWTPVGELKGCVSAEVNIIGSLYDDWYVTESS